MTRLVLVTCLLAIELVAISVGLKNFVDFECRSTGLEDVCLAISHMPIRALAVAGVLALFAVSRPPAFIAMWHGRRPSGGWLWAGLHGGGVALILLAGAFLSNDLSLPGFGAVIGLLLLGGLAMASGAILFIAPVAQVLAALRSLPVTVLSALIVAALAPEWGRLAQFVWEWDPLTDMTFRAVEQAVTWLGYSVLSNGGTKELQIGDFAVLVGPQCSGIEGFGLTLLFLGTYVTMFRARLLVSRVMCVIPLALAVSWSFNVVRITTLMVIGEEISPDLAINGFHSHAGWLLFTILALGLATVLHVVPWFQKGDTVSTHAPKVEFWQDRAVVMVLPFVVFMATDLILSTFAEVTELFYPWRMAVMAVALAVVWRGMRTIDWVWDPLAMGIGAVIAVIWLWAAPANADPALAAGLAAMRPVGLTIWIAARLAGTVLVVPFVEEMCFRGYLLDQFRERGVWVLFLGIAISSVLFGALHGKWLLAGLAGVVFGLLTLRQAGLSRAIQAHVAANTLIALAALWQDDFSLL